MCQVSVTIPDEVISDRGLTVSKAQDLARRMTALGLYVSENVSLGYCSEIAGMHKEDFIRFLGTFGVSIFCYDSSSELEEDFANAEQTPVMAHNGYRD